MRIFYSVDPGVKCTGIALWQEGRMLDATVARAKDIGGMIRALDRLLAVSTEGCVVERPQIYQKSKGDPNDLVSIAVIAGAAAAFTEGVPVFVKPRAWKGNVPKEIHNKRILSKLHDDEAWKIDSDVPTSLAHNMIDAIGIGLWYLESEGLRART